MTEIDSVNYGFTHTDANGKQYRHEVTLEDATWPEVLNDFVSFIEGVYGYNIRSSIRIEAPKYCINDGTWHGKFFKSDDASER